MMKKTIVKILCVTLAILNCGRELVAQSHKSYPAVFSLDAAVLLSNKLKINAGDPSLIPAYKQLLTEASEALQFKPVSVMEKINEPPSGNKHDYMSIAPYFWPDSSKPGGVPYINKDGQINPEVNEYMDKIYLAAVCDKVSTLALAWYFSGDNRYAAHAAKLLRV